MSGSTRLVEFPIEAGGTVLVQMTENGGVAGPVTRGLSGTSIAARAEQSLEEALRRVRPAVEAVTSELRSLASAPDEVHVEFGLDLHAEAGAFIAAASTTATFTVALTWRRPPS